MFCFFEKVGEKGQGLLVKPTNCKYDCEQTGGSEEETKTQQL